MGIPAMPHVTPASVERRRPAQMLVIGSLIVSAIALTGLVQHVEPFASWFFVFAWWSYIFLLDGLTYLRRGSSLLLTRPRGFLYLVPWSAAFWLFFELANLQLSNWYYIGLPADPLTRFLGIFAAFSTVLPAIFETTDFLSTIGVGELASCSAKTWRITDRRRSLMTWVGVLFLVLPLLIPRYTFPLIWGATTLLLEPALAGKGQTCLWTHLHNRRPGTPIRLLLAGAICGLCWESWNFWASAKWVYTVPFFDELKVFEMPILGFLGFPLFALECYTFARFLVARQIVPEWEANMPRQVVSRNRQAGWALGAIAFCVPAIFLVDRFIVRSTAMELEDFHSLSPQDVVNLRAAGIASGHDLHAALQIQDAMPAMEPDRLRDVRWESELARTAGMGARGVHWLKSVGVTGVDELGLREPNLLTGSLQADGRGPAPTPSKAEVLYWVSEAAED